MSNAWQQIQAIRAGSSDRDYRDPRSYGTALSQEGYPNIGQWAQGHWPPENIDECQQLLKDAISRGSRPLLNVAMIVLSDFPDVKQIIWGRLSEHQRTKVRSMIQIMT